MYAALIRAKEIKVEYIRGVRDTARFTGPALTILNGAKYEKTARK